MDYFVSVLGVIAFFLIFYSIAKWLEKHKDHVSISESVETPEQFNERIRQNEMYDAIAAADEKRWNKFLWKHGHKHPDQIEEENELGDYSV